LVIGLEVNYDILGIPVSGLPDLGAITAKLYMNSCVSFIGLF
jgi:hypothetical protein